MKYLLDTDSMIFIIRGTMHSTPHPRRSKAEKIIARIQNAVESGNTVGISAITKAELEYGAAGAANPDREQSALNKILFPFEQYDFDAQESAKRYGAIRIGLEKRGLSIGGMDFLIAAHALSLGAVVITNNLREFGRIPGLIVENWS